MQRFAKRTAAVAVATVALLVGGVATASADENTTGNTQGSILSGNNVDLDLLNNVTLCDIAVGALLGIANTGGCEVDNSSSGGDTNTTGNTQGSILSGNNVDAEALNNVTVCDVAVAAVLALANTGGCTVDNSSSGGDTNTTGNTSGSIASGNNVDVDAANNITVCGVSVGVLGIANTPPCEVDNETTPPPPDGEEPEPPNGGNGGNGSNNAHRPPPSEDGMLASTGAGALLALAPVGVAMLLAGVGIFRRFRGDDETAVEALD